MYKVVALVALVFSLFVNAATNVTVTDYPTPIEPEYVGVSVRLDVVREDGKYYITRSEVSHYSLDPSVREWADYSVTINAAKVVEAYLVPDVMDSHYNKYTVTFDMDVLISNDADSIVTPDFTIHNFGALARVGRSGELLIELGE